MRVNLGAAVFYVFVTDALSTRALRRVIVNYYPPYLFIKQVQFFQAFEAAMITGIRVARLSPIKVKMKKVKITLRLVDHFSSLFETFAMMKLAE